jgi:hypothetical protein
MTPTRTGSSVEQVDSSELVGLPKDGLSGAGAVERMLTGLLR